MIFFNIYLLEIYCEITVFNLAKPYILVKKYTFERKIWCVEDYFYLLDLEKYLKTLILRSKH